MPLGWKIEHTPPGGPAVDISALVAGFSITASLQAYCRELTVDVIDRAFFDALDFSSIPQAPSLEVFTRTDSAWESQGKFFVERPVFAADPDSDAARGIWGRSATAAAGEPFAARITQSWDADTTFYAVCAAMCAAAGLPWQDSDADIDDFIIFAGTYTAEKKYPIEILQELAGLAGALVSCDRTGHLRIRAVDYAPATADITVDDAVIRRITTQPRYPRFGNRVKIIPTGATSGYRLQLYVPDACINARSAFTKAVYARVTDANGDPVENAVVNWSLTYAGSGVQGLAALAVANGNTGTRTVFSEKQRAESFYRVKTRLPVATVQGIYAVADIARGRNFIAGGYSLDGSDGAIVLVDPFDYCDQAVVIDYTSAGIAVNALVPAGAAGDAGQSATLTASAGGVRDQADIYINNPCHCPISLALTAKPSSININEESKLLVYAEESGGPVTDGRQVFLSQQNRVGFLKATLLRLSAVAISDEPTRAVNVVAGITQCDVSMWPSSVYAVYAADDNGRRSGANLYAANTGKRINLNTPLETGVNLLVSYYALGTAITTFRGAIAGTAHIRAQIRAHTEAPVEATTDISVADPVSPVDDNWTPADWTPWDEPAWDDTGYYDDDAYDEGDNEGDTETDCATLCDTQKSDCEKACSDQYPGGGQDYDDCMTACANDHDSCSSDCTAANDPSQKTGKWDPQFEDTTCNGKTCGDGERCCAVGTDFDCRTDQACADAQGSSYGGAGDDCDAVCADEMDRYGTTRVFDGGSMRSIDTIVRQDYGYEDDSSPQYWDKYNELATQARADCVEDCTPCEAIEALTADAPDTLAPGSDAIITISGGKKPFTAALTQKPGQDNGFSLAAVVDRQAVLSQSAAGCGSAEVTITDSCGNSQTIQIRSTSGQWVFLDNTCGAPGPATSQSGSTYTRIAGRFKQNQKYFQTGHYFGTCLYVEPPCGNQGYSCTPPSDPAPVCIDFTLCGFPGGNDQFPCCYQSAADYDAEHGTSFGNWCRGHGALGATNMYCYDSPKNELKLFEWQC